MSDFLQPQVGPGRVWDPDVRAWRTSAGFYTDGYIMYPSAEALQAARWTRTMATIFGGVGGLLGGVFGGPAGAAVGAGAGAWIGGKFVAPA